MRATGAGKGGAAKRLGKLPPLFKFYLNPYLDVRFSVCVKCQGKTKLRKLPLVIHVEPLHPLVLNMTCRYCPYCDLLVVHRDELESLLASYYSTANPEVIGNDYLVLGTLERAAWQRSTRTPLSFQETIENLHDFKRVEQFKIVGGWQKMPGSPVGAADAGEQG